MTLAQMPEVIYVDLDQVVPFEDRGETFDEEKVVRLMEAFQAEGILAPATARKKSMNSSYAPGKYELCTWHNRRQAAIRLGLKRIPIVVFNGTEEQFVEKYLRDNNEKDRPATNYALGAVRIAERRLTAKFTREFGPRGWKEQLQDFIARSTGFRPHVIEKLQEMNKNLEAGTLTSKISQQRDVNTATYLSGVFERNSVSIENQEKFLNAVQRMTYGPEIERHARLQFNEGKPRVKKERVIRDAGSYLLSASRALREATAQLREVEDDSFSDYEEQLSEVELAIAEYRDIVQVEEDNHEVSSQESPSTEAEIEVESAH